MQKLYFHRLRPYAAPVRVLYRGGAVRPGSAPRWFAGHRRMGFGKVARQV